MRAQLRPLAPIDWPVLVVGGTIAVRVGVGIYTGQRLSLAGAAGRLIEIGDFSVVWRLDRVAFEVGGAAYRWFEERSHFSHPIGGARRGIGARRTDAGDVRIGTMLRLARTGRMIALLRFGTRLPTTDNVEGLERDQTDFFALVAGHLVQRRLSLGVETGIGINGTRDTGSEQVDVLLYGVTVRYDTGPVTPVLTFLGQADGLTGPSIRGTEDLRELRVGLRIGGRTSAGIDWTRGLTDFSPASGFTLIASNLR